MLPADFKDIVLAGKSVSLIASKTVEARPMPGDDCISVTVRLPGFVDMQRVCVEICSMTPSHDHFSPMMPAQKGQNLPTRAILELGDTKETLNVCSVLVHDMAPGLLPSGVYRLAADVPAGHRVSRYARLKIDCTDAVDSFVRVSKISLIGRDGSQSSAHCPEDFRTALDILLHMCATVQSSERAVLLSRLFARWTDPSTLANVVKQLVSSFGYKDLADDAADILRPILLAIASSIRGGSSVAISELLQSSKPVIAANLAAELCLVPADPPLSASRLLHTHVFEQLKSSDDTALMDTVEPFVSALARVQSHQQVSMLTADEARQLLKWLGLLEPDSTSYDCIMGTLCSSIRCLEATEAQMLLASVISEETIGEQCTEITLQASILGSIACGSPAAARIVLNSSLPRIATQAVMRACSTATSVDPSAILALKFLKDVAWSHEVKDETIQAFLPELLDGLQKRFEASNFVSFNDDLLEAAVEFLTVAIHNHRSNQELIVSRVLSYMQDSKHLTTFLARMAAWLATTTGKVVLCLHPDSAPEISGVQSEASLKAAENLNDGKPHIETIDVSSNSAASHYLNDGESSTFWDSYVDDAAENAAGSPHWIILRLAKPQTVLSLSLCVGHIDDVSYRPAHVKISGATGVNDGEFCEIGEFVEPDANNPQAADEIEIVMNKYVLAKVVKIELLRQCQEGWDVQINSLKLVVKDSSTGEGVENILAPWLVKNSPLRYHRQQPLYEVPSAWSVADVCQLAGVPITFEVHLSTSVDAKNQPLASLDSRGSNILDVRVSENAFSNGPISEQLKKPSLELFEIFEQRGGMHILIDRAVSYLIIKDADIKAADASSSTLNVAGRWALRLVKREVSFLLTQSADGKLSGSGDKHGTQFVVRGNITGGKQWPCLSLALTFDDGSTYEFADTPLDGENMTAQGEMTVLNRAGHKATSIFTAQKQESQAEVHPWDVQKWIGWLNSLRSWCAIPHFRRCFVQNSVGRRMLFFTLGIEETIADLPPTTVTNPHMVLNKVAIALLTASGDGDIRRVIVEKGWIESSLLALAATAGVECRRNAEDTLAEKSFAPSGVGTFPAAADVQSDETADPTDSAQRFLQKKPKGAKKKKGVGYGVDGADDISWNIDAKVASEDELAEKLQDNLALLAALINTQDPAGLDWSPTPELAERWLASALLPAMEKMLQCDSLLEVGRRPDLYKAIMNLLEGMANHSCLCPLLDTVGATWLPCQEVSISVLVKKMAGLADIYLKCLESGRGSIQALDGHQFEGTEQLAQLIMRTAHTVGLRFGNGAVQERHISGSDYFRHMSPLMFRYTAMHTSGVFKHHFQNLIKTSAKQPPTAKLVRLAQELADISTSLPCEATNPIFLRVDDSRIDTMKALVMGAHGTPYSTGCFEFHIFMEVRSETAENPRRPNETPKRPPVHGRARTMFVCFMCSASLPHSMWWFWD